jgi:hypothetical protein
MGQTLDMRRLIAIPIAAAALAVGCGSEDAPDTAAQAGQQAEQTADQTDGQTTQTTDRASAEGIAAATQQLANELAAAARELARNPDADVDTRLRDAEEQANTLSERTKDSFDEHQPKLSSALQDANRRLARAAANLQDADSVEDVQKVLERELGVAGDRLSDAAADAKELAGGDAQRQLEQARDQLERLRDELTG